PNQRCPHRESPHAPRCPTWGLVLADLRKQVRWRAGPSPSSRGTRQSLRRRDRVASGSVAWSGLGWLPCGCSKLEVEVQARIIARAVGFVRSLAGINAPVARDGARRGRLLVVNQIPVCVGRRVQWLGSTAVVTRARQEARGAVHVLDRQ